MTRRDYLKLTLTATCARTLPAQTPEINQRITSLITAYETQGIHRTGTPTDKISADWLTEQIRQTGLKPTQESFPLNRVDLLENHLTLNSHQIEGIPLFDGTFTDAQGIRGQMGPLGSEAPLGFTELTPNAAAAGPLSEARHQNHHRAIIAITKGGKPGLCPSNADNFLNPFGPPVLQVSSEYAPQLREAAKNATEATVVAQVKRTPAEAFNVTTLIPGSNRSAPPLIVMTPRSGWWTCASERGGGIACWVELMRALKNTKPARDIIFVASSGHEVGYLGVEAFVAQRPGIVKAAHAWIHFGANIGAAQDPGNTVQSSDNEMEALETEAMTKVSLKVDRRVPHRNIPGGEAGVVHRGGGIYMSIIGRNALFHNPADRGPEAIDAATIAKFATAFTGIAKQLAA
jgi:hypothetical protein